MKGQGFKIRVRDRIDSSPPAGMSQSWTEYQVVSRSKIIERFGTLEHARRDYPGAELDSSVINEETNRKAARGKR